MSLALSIQMQVSRITLRLNDSATQLNKEARSWRVRSKRLSARRPFKEADSSLRLPSSDLPQRNWLDQEWLQTSGWVQLRRHSQESFQK